MNAMGFKEAVYECGKRWVIAVCWQIPWFALFSGGIWYLKERVNGYLVQAFDLSFYTQNAVLWQKRTAWIYENLSFSNPSSYADYIKALSANAFASAKESITRQTVSLLTDFAQGLFDVIFVIGCVYVVMRVIRLYKEQTRNDEIADAVVAKLRPLLERQDKSDIK